MAPVAVADPAESTSPSTPETTETTTATETPTETSAPESPASSESSAPSAPESPSEAPRQDVAAASVYDFAVNATFDKPSYATGEDMRITVSITNNGTTATTVSTGAWGQDPDLVQVRDMGDLNRTVPIAAGETVTVKFTGAVGNPDITTARLRLGVNDETGALKYFEFTVPVTPTFGHASGTAFDDRDGDNRFDAGEALAGATITWQSNLHNDTRFTVTTGADGTFSLPELPTGPYFVSGTAPDGLLIGYRGITVDESGVDGLLVRAVRPITDLDVDLEFGKDTYGKDETPTVDVTLTNTGDLPLTGILAFCNRSGGSQGLQGRSAGWGGLAEGGVTIAPHSTLELEVSEPMPEGAYRYGHVVVGCDFGYEGIDEGTPWDNDRAAVPGMRGDITGFIGHDETGLAGVRVVLVTEEHCPIVAEATTDEGGDFAFEQVPVGVYDLYMFPPDGWRITYGNPTSTMLIGGQGPAELYIDVEPGDEPAPELPEQPADCEPGAPATTTAPPAPQGSATPGGLASTGASIGTPVAFGMLALLTGFGSLLVTRRRRTS